MVAAAAIELDQVDAHRQERLALDNVSFDIPRGAVASVVGSNGAGKSTLLGLISGRLRPSRGTVTVDGSVAEVLQAVSIDEQVPLTVEDVVRQGRYRERGLLRPMTKRDRKIVADALASVEMLDHRRTPICNLSGGQRQRVLVAQGLAQRSPILLLDEPTAGVDVPTQHRLNGIIRDVARRGVTVLYSTHNYDDAAQSDLMVALDRRCVCCAPVEEALANPHVVELFGGTNHPGQRSGLRR